MRDKDQIIRFNSGEMQLIKDVFATNTELLFIIRKVFFQFELSAGEKLLLNAALAPDVYSLLKKTFLPELDSDSPLFQMSDMRVGLLSELRARDVDQMEPYFEAKKIEIDYISQQLEFMKDGNASQKIKLKDLAEIGNDGYKNYVNLTAWNFLVSYIDTNVQQLKLLAGQQNETPEETLKKLQKNSPK